MKPQSAANKTKQIPPKQKTTGQIPSMNRYKNSPQNISKLNPTTYKKDHVPKPRGIYHKFTRMLQHMQNQSMSAQSRPTLNNPMDCSLLGSSVHGNSQGKNTGVGCHTLRGVFLNPGIELESLTSSALAGGFFTTSATWESPM